MPLGAGFLFVMGIPQKAGKCSKMHNISVSVESSIDRLKEISTWVSSVQDLDQLLELPQASAVRRKRKVQKGRKATAGW